MSLKVEYENAQEANFRLQGTLVLYDGEPVYVSQVLHEPDLPKGDIFRVYTSSLPFNGVREGDRRYISSGKFDLTPFRMGFVNLNGDAVYLSRNSARQNRQGLGERTLSAQALKEDVALPRFTALIREQAFVDCIKGKYPPVEQALKKLQEANVNSVAISREYAVAKHDTLDELLVIYHKNTVVGFMETSGKAFKLGKKFQFLKQELEERNIPYC